MFDKLVIELNNVKVARIDKVLCNDKSDRCLNTKGHDVYYYDDDHLSNAGARLIAPTIVSAVESADNVQKVTDLVHITKWSGGLTTTH